MKIDAIQQGFSLYSTYLNWHIKAQLEFFITQIFCLIFIMKVIYLALIAILLTSQVRSKFCQCHDITQELECIHYSQCRWEATSKTCRPTVCTDLAEGKCHYINSLGVESNCHWTGAKCESYKSCTDMTFTAEQGLTQCPNVNCDYDATTKKCKARPAPAPAPKVPFACSTLVGGCYSSSSDGIICYGDYSGSPPYPCYELDQTKTCVQLLVQLACNANSKCYWLSTQKCVDRTCTDAAFDCNSVYLSDGACYLDATNKCVKVLRTDSCAARTTKNSCDKLSTCIFDATNKCRTKICKDRGCTKLTTYQMSQDDQDLQFCKYTTECAEATSADFKDVCLIETDGYFHSTGTDCIKCVYPPNSTNSTQSDQLTSLKLEMVLFTVVMMSQLL